MNNIKIRCVQSLEPWFTDGKIYDVIDSQSMQCGSVRYRVLDDHSDNIDLVYPDEFYWSGSKSYFELIENLEDSFSTEAEEEEWQRLEHKVDISGLTGAYKKRIFEDFQKIESEHWQKVIEDTQEPVDCSVAIAYHIHEIQKWLKHIGCDSEAEFRISSDYAWASSDTSATYEAKEGGVGTLIEYMRHIGGANKCVEKMENVG